MVGHTFDLYYDRHNSQCPNISGTNHSYIEIISQQETHPNKCTSRHSHTALT